MICLSVSCLPVLPNCEATRVYLTVSCLPVSWPAVPMGVGELCPDIEVMRPCSFTTGSGKCQTRTGQIITTSQIRTGHVK